MTSATADAKCTDIKIMCFVFAMDIAYVKHLIKMSIIYSFLGEL